MKIDSKYLSYLAGTEEACSAKPWTDAVHRHQRAIQHDWKTFEKDAEGAIVPSMRFVEQELFCDLCGGIARWRDEKALALWRGQQAMNEMLSEAFGPLANLMGRHTSMKHWVRLHKDGEHMGIETNCTEERDFWTQFSAVLATAIEGKFLGHAEEQLQRWLPQAFEVVAQLRGYKANVVIEQIVKSGEVYSGNQEVFTSEKPHLSVVAKDQVG